MRVLSDVFAAHIRGPFRGDFLKKELLRFDGLLMVMPILHQSFSGHLFQEALRDLWRHAIIQDTPFRAKDAQATGLPMFMSMITRHSLADRRLSQFPNNTPYQFLKKIFLLQSRASLTLALFLLIKSKPFKLPPPPPLIPSSKSAFATILSLFILSSLAR